ncbi:pyruvate, water dikinase regulatory protein [Planomicrobium sp. CPCC 101110]|uniref:pyruvate, water dikinase regulatory protein n=1 Tax=Planomicrobium sp. CPCC 101110 TaxID=2599619 RepID=UPI0011B74E5C|nr:pyruvate, water dikinase regulatory protein [Planomicrobium sp. CPCC 101110]TWT26058.1 kinase/pyrophosphorylase [Planomicrobium sp. CPCC 101110]
MSRKEIVYVLSDSIGETAQRVVKAVAVQFLEEKVEIHQTSHVSRESDIEEVIQKATREHSIIVFTIVVDDLRDYLNKRAREENITAVDLLAPLMDAFVQKFKREPAHTPGLTRVLDEKYFQKVEAIEFAVKYDDARDIEGIKKADIVLIGVSRTSKTPLSMYLAYRGFKVANIPLVPEVPVPTELFDVPKGRCIGLIIKPDSLNAIRKERLKKMGLQPNATYAQLDRILEELDYAEKIMKRIGCPVINVSNKAIEETANDVMDILDL